MTRRLGPLASTLLLGGTLQAAEPVDWEMVGRIRAEGFHRSQVMETLRTLTDEIGPRLTGSPGMTAANEWTRDKLADWGWARARQHGSSGSSACDPKGPSAWRCGAARSRD